MLGHAFAEKRGDVGGCRQILKLRQAGKIKFRLGFAFSDGRGGCARIRSRLVTVRLLRLLFALRPAREKALAVAGTSSSSISGDHMWSIHGLSIERRRSTTPT